MTDTIELIKQWGADRGITINGTHRGQWYKLASEYGELCDNLAKGKDIKDDIGDMFVVLVMISEIGKVDLDKAMNLATCVKWQDAEVYDLVGWMLLSVGALRYKSNIDRAVDIIAALAALAEAHDTTLDECIDIAYQDIKSRVGFLTADGVFVKEPVSAQKQIDKIEALIYRSECETTSAAERLYNAGCRIGGGE